MSAECFLDTNLFIYDIDIRDPRKTDLAGRIIQQGIQTGNACISFQVVQECMNTFLRKAEIRLEHHEVRRYMDNVLVPLFQIPATTPLYHRALDIQERYQYGFYDALIIASALEGGCRRLYSEDLHDGQRIGGLLIENPFKD